MKTLNEVPMQYTHYDSEQFLFDRTMSGLWAIGKLLFKAVAYLPLFMTGYLLADQVLENDQAAVLWMTVIVGFAFALFLLLYVLKGMIIALQKAGNLLWVPIFILCIAYAC